MDQNELTIEVRDPRPRIADPVERAALHAARREQAEEQCADDRYGRAPALDARRDGQVGVSQSYVSRILRGSLMRLRVELAG